MTGKPMFTIVNTFSQTADIKHHKCLWSSAVFVWTCLHSQEDHGAYGQEVGHGQECDSRGVHTMAPSVNRVSGATRNEPSLTLSIPKWAENPHALSHQAELWANHFLLLTSHLESTKTGHLILTSTLAIRGPFNERRQGCYSGLAIKSPFYISSYLSTETLRLKKKAVSSVFPLFVEPGMIGVYNVRST